MLRHCPSSIQLLTYNLDVNSAQELNNTIIKYQSEGSEQEKSHYLLPIQLLEYIPDANGA